MYRFYAPRSLVGRGDIDRVDALMRCRSKQPCHHPPENQMKRKEQVRPEDLRGKSWLWLERRADPVKRASGLNPADALIIEAWVLSTVQAEAEGFDEDDAKDIGSDVMTALMERLVKNPALLERPDDFERRRRYITKTTIYNWRRTGRRAKAGQAELTRFLEAYLPGWMFADRRVECNTGSRRLNEAMAKLSRDEQVAVFLRHGLGWKPKAIAKFTDDPVGQIKIRIHRGMKLLRELMSARPSDLTEIQS
jgi:DNA-directed RNA polymerase specialized sigma24 family protein